MGRASRPGVVISEVEVAASQALLDDSLESGLLGCSRRKRAVGPPNGMDIPDTHAHTVDVREVQLAGITYALYTFSGNPTSGTMLELDAIAAAVIGGTLLSGGVGTVLGTVLGVLIFGVIQTAIIFDGRLSSWWTRITIGGLLLAFLVVQRLLHNILATRGEAE